jgi:lipoprotein-anchoring transpeptidase ErfK/SrfK
MIPLPRDPASLRKEFTPAQLAIMEKLNRRDLAHMAREQPPVPGLVVPLVWPSPDDVTALNPLPDTFPWAEAYPKAIVVHQPWQAFAAYESGRLVRWGPVSTGRKETPTPSGLFNLTWRSKGRYSTDNAAWFLPWYFNFINERGVSFHQFDLPGYAASHACVRLLERDAKWLYDWGDQWKLDESGRRIVTAGTPVLIVGEFEHPGPVPWIDLAALSRRILLTPPTAH